MKTPALAIRAVLIVGGAAILTGCVVNPGGAFSGVENAVSGASGKRVKWMRGNADAAEVEKTVEAMLREPLTADTAAQIALLNNRALQARFEEIGISHANYIQAGLPRNPSVGGHLDFSRDGRSYEFSAAQEIMSLLLLPLRRKVAAAELEMTKKRIAAEVLGLVAETKTAFYELQARRQMCSRLELITEANEAAAEIAKRQHDAGNITDLDLANQSALFNQSRIDVAQTEVRIRSGRERLNRLMGLWGAQTAWKIGDSLPPIPKKEISTARVEQLAVAQRLDLAMARQKVDATGLALALRTKTRYTPVSLDLGAHGEMEPDTARGLGPRLDIELPIFDFGQAAVAQLQAQHRQAVRELEALAINARSEVREARDLVVAGRDLADYHGKVLLPQRIQIVNQTQLQYNAMQVGPIDLLQAKERELDTERAYIEAWQNYWIARTELERALWGGTGGGATDRSMADGGSEGMDH